MAYIQTADAMRATYMTKAAEMLEAAQDCIATASAETYISIAYHYMKLAEMNTPPDVKHGL